MQAARANQIWHNGRLKRWEEATVHVLAHGLHYGSSVFEGVRAYATEGGPVFFRLREHLVRLLESARTYRIESPYDLDTIEAACAEVIRANQFQSAYLRPILYRGAGTLSLLPGPETPVEAAVAAIAFGEYLGDGAVKRGIDAGVSSWRRQTSSSTPILAKAGGHYLNAQLIAGEAARNGYAEGIALDESGRVCEGSGENLFVVRDGVILTPPLGQAILAGITRDSVITLAKRAGLDVREASIPREALYNADELFMTGTAVEITPVCSIDRIPIGSGHPGPLTRRIQEQFFGLFSGETLDEWGWCTPVYPAAPLPLAPTEPTAPTSPSGPTAECTR